MSLKAGADESEVAALIYNIQLYVGTDFIKMKQK